MRTTNSLLFGLHVLACVTAAVDAAEERPNIVILVADDLGWADVGFHGGDVKTPHLDKLAATGIELTRFYVCPVCSPTRAGLMTGRYPDRYGMRRGVIAPTRMHGLPPQEETIAEMLAQVGYKHRACIGKWHLGHSHVKYHPLNQGFTRFYGHYNGAIDYFRKVRDAELDWHSDFDSNFDEGYSTDLIGREAVRFINEVAADGPFFLYVPFNAPHSPMQAKRDDLRRYGFDNKKPAFGGGTGRGTGGSRPGERELNKYGKIGNGNTIRQTYQAMVTSMDEAIGKILATIEATGNADNTLIWFCSDNGGTPTFGGDNRPRRGNKGSVYEGGVCVNCVVRWPARDLSGGKTNDLLACYLDVMPTLRSVVGAGKKPAKPLDGRNVLDQLSGSRPPSNRTIYLGPRAVVQQEWKFVKGQLFTIDKDRNESTNMSEKHLDLTDRLKKLANEFERMEVQPLETGKFEPLREWKMPGRREQVRDG